MVKCDALTVAQLKQMCKIELESVNEFYKDKYSGYSKLSKDDLVPKCCGGRDDWVNPTYTRRLSGTIHRQLNRPKGNITGVQFVEWIRDNLERDGLVRTSRWSGGEMTGWTKAWGDTGYSISEAFSVAGFDEHKIEKGDIDLHVELSGKEIGLKYREWTEWDDEREETIPYHEPLDPDKAHPRIKKTLERLGLNVKQIRSTGAQMHWDDDVSYNVLMTRPKYLSNKNKS